MITRNLEKAREAFLKKDKKLSKAAHSMRVAPEKHQQGSGQYLKSAVYGGLDGTITTFSVVAGVAGASLSSSVVLIMGFANLIGDGISMAIGDYLSTKSEREYQKAERKREEWEATNYPEGEKREMVGIYRSKGLSERDSKKMVELMAKDKKAWVDIMMVEELGMIESRESPLRNSIATFLSFCIFGFVPIASYVISKLMGLNFNTFGIAAFMTGATLFLLGMLKAKFANRNVVLSGLEMLLVGGLAAGAAYLIGHLLSGL